jgi:hypothetical protein
VWRQCDKVFGKDERGAAPGDLPDRHQIHQFGPEEKPAGARHERLRYRDDWLTEKRFSEAIQLPPAKDRGVPITGVFNGPAAPTSATI